MRDQREASSTRVARIPANVASTVALPSAPSMTVALELDLFAGPNREALAHRRPHAQLGKAVAARHGPQATHSRYSGTSQTAPSGGSVRVAENGCSCHGTASASTPPRFPTPLPP